MANDSKEKGEIEGFAEAFGSDKNLEELGAWAKIPGMPGNEICLRSQHTPRVRNAAAQLNKRHTPLFQARKPVPAEEQDADLYTLLSKEIVTAWKGPKFEHLPCTPGNVAAVMRKYPAFATWCNGWSDERQNYNMQATEELKGNSEAVSSET